MIHPRRTAFATLALLAAAGTVSPALADSRIFTARASAPGVTIDEASRNGETLAVVGHGDGTTLFRIDSPSTPVGCANRIEFVTSTGEVIDQVADMCALNWTVTVEVAELDEPDVPDVPGADTRALAEETIDAPAAASDDASFTQAVKVSADDPTATIIAIKLDGETVRITGREANAVLFEVAGTDEGIVCDRDVGLTLSDGRTITRKTNICLNDWTVVVALAGDDDAVVADVAPPPPPPPSPPTSTLSELAKPPTSQLSPLPTPQAAVPPVADAGLVWMFSSFDNQASLVHGIPETDAMDFMATCARRSGRISVQLLEAEVVGLTPGSPIAVTLSAGGFSRTYPGVGSPFDQIVGASLPEVEISAGDPVWSAIIREANLTVAAGPVWRGTLSLAGSAGPARQLLAACSEAAPPPPVAAVGPGIVANFYCANGTVLNVTFNGANRTALLVEAGAPPLTLHWVAGSGKPRYASGQARLVQRSDNEVRWARFGGPAQACFVR